MTRSRPSLTRHERFTHSKIHIAEQASVGRNLAESHRLWQVNAAVSLVLMNCFTLLIYGFLRHGQKSLNTV
jgi:hypothetical protein